MSQLANAIFTETRQRVLGMLYGQPGRSFFLKEILRHTGMGVGTVKRELDRLLAAGIVTLRKSGNQHHYQADSECPIYNELCAIIEKTVGMVDPLAKALAPLADEIDCAFVFGSLASGRESTGSDIDLMVIGNVSFSSVARVLHPVEQVLGREINPKVYLTSKWEQKQQAGDNFIKSIMESPQLNVIGKIEEVSKES
ncbi:MAG: nucleotidyltransferase domain-containing protein [Proteobacteria bacterium]|nr:nucleotidyltransferase domain-containing protein [Pseudomonadota bacterium]